MFINCIHLEVQGLTSQSLFCSCDYTLPIWCSVYNFQSMICLEWYLLPWILSFPSMLAGNASWSQNPDKLTCSMVISNASKPTFPAHWFAWERNNTHEKEIRKSLTFCWSSVQQSTLKPRKCICWIDHQQRRIYRDYLHCIITPVIEKNRQKIWLLLLLFNLCIHLTDI